MRTSQYQPNTDNLERYRIHSTREILAFLEEIRQQRQLVRMTFNQGRESVLTSILDVDATDKLVYIDATPYPARDRRIELTQQIAFETMLNRIPIRFTASNAQRCNHNGFAALRFTLPESLIRLQRRHTYRVGVPPAQALQCIFMPPGTEMRPLEAPLPLDVLNISLGGIAILDTSYQLDGRPGTLYSPCQIGFPGYPATVSLEVRHAHVTFNRGETARHVGLRFVDTSSSVIALVQRYIMKLEREQNARSLDA